MAFDQKRAWKALGVGILITLPLMYVYFTGEGTGNAVIDVVASTLMMPAMIFTMPLYYLILFIEYPDRDALDSFYYIIPFFNVLFYAVLAYGIFMILEEKK